MSFFGYSHTKPGKGVSPDEPKKTGLMLFFQLLKRHFWDFMKENIIYILISLPVILIYYLVFTVYDLWGIQAWFIKENDIWTYETIKVLITLITVILCGTGPASAAMASMMKNVSKGLPWFPWSDFRDMAKKNFKNGTLMLICDILLMGFVFPGGIYFYVNTYLQNPTIVYMVMMILFALIFLCYILMHKYYYQIIVSYKMGFKEAFKTSFQMAAGYLPYNILIAVIPVVLTVLLGLYFSLMVVLFLAFVCWVAFMRFPLEFSAMNKIEKVFTAKAE